MTELKKHGEKLRERICQFITNYTVTHSYAPTVREIGAGIGLKSSLNVLFLMTILPFLENAVPFRAILVGKTQSIMSIPLAKPSIKQSGLPTPIK